MAKLPLEELTIVLLKKGIAVDEFNCGDDDLNDFLKTDAFAYGDNELAQTYVALYQNTPVAFVSLCTDAIKLSKEEMEQEFGKEKPHPDYPAMKIARLAVAEAYKSSDVGTAMVKYAVGRAIEISESIGCRFVTTDAYESKAGFYEKCNFIRNQKDSSGQNVSMRLDLLPFKQAGKP